MFVAGSCWASDMVERAGAAADDGGIYLMKVKRVRAEDALRKDGQVAWGRTTAPPLAKARQRTESPSVPVRAPIGRAELLDKATRVRLEDEVDAALRRRPATEPRLAGAIRAVAPLSPALRASLGEATAVLLRRGARGRELYACGLRSLAEAQDRQAVALLRRALAGEEAGGPAALSAACFSRDPELAGLLAKIAASRQAHLAFGAELARVARGESNGALLVQLAPMIKESHRISMCIELFVPLARALPLARHVGPALTVLRGAERHLGRWLLLAEVAVKTGDTSPLLEAESRARTGPVSSRAAWSLVEWALRDADAMARGIVAAPHPTTRPTLELIARLSDRPSAERDTTFLFRMARAGAPAARSMLETFARALPFSDETSIRAALHLARDRVRDDLREALAEAATNARREEIRGLAAAALWDASPVGDPGSATTQARSLEIAEGLLDSRVIGNVAWAALIRASARAGPSVEPLLGETMLRWVQWGWLE